MGSTWGGSSSASSTAHMRIQIPHRLFITFQYVWEARLALITHQLKATLCQPLPPSLTLSYAQAQNWFDNQDLYICVIFQSLFRLERAKSGAGRRILRELYATWRGVIRRAKNVAYLQGRHLHSSLKARTHTHRERERERERQGHRHIGTHVKSNWLIYLISLFLPISNEASPKDTKWQRGRGRKVEGEGGNTSSTSSGRLYFIFMRYTLHIIYIYMYWSACIYYIEYIICFYVFSLLFFLFSVFGFVSYLFLFLFFCWALVGL